MTSIVKVEPVEPIVSLTWMLGSRCNYDCMYCPPSLHDSTSKHPDLDTLKQVWLQFYNKTCYLDLPYKISFTGGEVTANKSFLPLVSWLINNYKIDQTSVSTNGSASKRYYLELADLVTSIGFSTHSEFFNEQEFFSKVESVNKIMIPPKKSVHVSIMDEWWNQDRIKVYQQWLDQRKINYSINKINYAAQTRSYPLTKGVKNLVA